MSPMPGRSTLITSAPMKASNCVQVGPDCTCVKSRMRTPSSALPAWPQGFDDGRGTPLLFADLAGGLCAVTMTTFFARFLAAGLMLLPADFFAGALDAFARSLDFAFVRVAIALLLSGLWPGNAVDRINAAKVERIDDEVEAFGWSCCSAQSLRYSGIQYTNSGL